MMQSPRGRKLRRLIRDVGSRADNATRNRTTGVALKLIDSNAARIAVVDAKSHGDETTPLWWACNNGLATIAIRLLDIEGIAVDAKSSIDGSTPLLLACTKGLEFEHVALRLLDIGGVDVNMKTKRDGCTPLWLACNKGFEAVAQKLLDLPGVDVNVANRSDDTTALWLACKKGFETVALKLIDIKGVNVNVKSRRDGTYPVWLACESEMTTVALRLLQIADIEINTKDSRRGITPLLQACTHGLGDVAMRLLELDGVEVDAVCYGDGTTPLYWSCYSNLPNVATRLLDMSTIDGFGNIEIDAKSARKGVATPLFWACANSQEKLALRLLNVGGADITVKYKPKIAPPEQHRVLVGKSILDVCYMRNLDKVAGRIEGLLRRGITIAPEMVGTLSAVKNRGTNIQEILFVDSYADPDDASAAGLPPPAFPTEEAAARAVNRGRRKFRTSLGMDDEGQAQALAAAAAAAAEYLQDEGYGGAAAPDGGWYEEPAPAYEDYPADEEQIGYEFDAPVRAAAARESIAWDATELAAALGAEGLADGFDMETWEEEQYGEYDESATAAATTVGDTAEWQTEGAYSATQHDEAAGDAAWDGAEGGESAAGGDGAGEYTEPAFEDAGAAGSAEVDWEAHVDAEGNMYFYSHVSDATVWAAPEAALEAGWSGVTEEATGHTYYVHDASGETRWEAPLRPEVPVIQE
jgi:ankyrin repeat protein